MMSKLERLNARVAKLLTTAVHEVLEVVKETVSEYQEKTARTQRENESLKRRLRELQDNAGENPPLPGSSNNPSQDKTIKDEIASQDKTIKDETEEVDPETGSSSERFSLTLQEEMRGEGMIFTDSDTVDCSVSLGLVTNTDLTAHVAYWLPGDEHDVSVSPPCSQTLPPIKTEPEPGYLCSPDQVEQGDTFNCGGVASGVSQCDSSANNTENPGMADTVQYSNQWKRELDPANQDAASSSCLGSIDALSCEMPIRRKSLRLKKKRSKSEPFVQSDTGEEEPLDWGGSESLFGSTSDDPAEPEPSQPGCRLVQKAVGRPKLYCCSLCGRVLRDDRDFEKHQLVHSGEKPHSCTQCNKRFSQLSILKNHQCHHTGEKPHNCSVCGKNFSSSNYLKIHQRCHTGELPYSCDQCGKHFSDCSNFKKHMLIHL